MNAQALMRAYGLRHRPKGNAVVKRNGVIRFADYDKNEPRVPKGQAGAGQWTSGALGAIAQQFAALGMAKEFPPATTSSLKEQSRERVEKAVAKGRKRVDDFVKSKAYSSGNMDAVKTILGGILLDAAKEIAGYVKCSLGGDGEALAEFWRIYQGECQKYLHSDENRDGPALTVDECVNRAREQLTGMIYAKDVLVNGRQVGDWGPPSHKKKNARKNTWLYLDKEKTYSVGGEKFKCTVTVVKEDPYRSGASAEKKSRRDVYNVKGIVEDSAPRFEVFSVSFERV